MNGRQPPTSCRHVGRSCGRRRVRILSFSISISRRLLIAVMEEEMSSVNVEQKRFALTIIDDLNATESGSRPLLTQQSFAEKIQTWITNVIHDVLVQYLKMQTAFNCTCIWRRHWSRLVWLIAGSESWKHCSLIEHRNDIKFDKCSHTETSLLFSGREIELHYWT